MLAKPDETAGGATFSEASGLDGVWGVVERLWKTQHNRSTAPPPLTVLYFLFSDTTPGCARGRDGVGTTLTFVGSGLQTHIQKYLIAQVLGYVNDFDL